MNIKKSKYSGYFNILISFIIMIASSSAFAKRISKKNTSINKSHKNESAIVVDADNGRILHKKDAYKKIYPASLTKLMTIYIVLDNVQEGKIKLDEKLIVSKKAANMRPSKLGLRYGEKIIVEDAIHAVNIKSANDAAVVLSERLAGSEEKFKIEMNKTAKKLGMRMTNFENSSGWHHNKQKTTAADMAKLAIALKRDFKQYMHWFSKEQFTYKGKIIKGHNKITSTYEGAEGLKTGYTAPSGYNLITSAVRDGKNLVAVVTGGKTSDKRDKKMVALLDRYFQDHKIKSDVFAAAEYKARINLKPVSKPENINIAKIKSIAKSRNLTRTNKSKRLVDKNNTESDNKRI